MARVNNTVIQEKLEHRILLGLSHEWETALWVLDEDLRGRMKKPLFSLGEMKERLGYWSRERREICLSRNLVFNHPWEAVRDVLLHEIAHQFASEILNSAGEPAHGPTFKTACNMLRAAPEASGAYRTLEEKLAHTEGASEDRIMLKVKKLMALSTSRNSHEAEAAMAKAHQLIEKHNIDLIAVDGKRNFVSAFLGKPALRQRREAYHLATLLTEFYYVTGLWVSTFVLEKGKMGRVLEISGTPQNIKIASYVYDFVNTFINIQWEAYNSDKGLNTYRKTDFAVGIIRGFHTKLKSRKIMADPASAVSAKGRSLAKVEDPRLKAYTAHRYPHTTSFRRKARNQDAGVMDDGIEIGKKLVISKGISERNGGPAALLKG